MTYIKIEDKLPPESTAMLQALYSRSPASVDEHLKKVESTGADQFMDKYYVGYGHRSIGDCGSTTIFIEGVSMLAAKAIQDWPLYSGQEASTRYMDFAKVEIADPAASVSSEGRIIQDNWMRFYNEAQEPLREYLLQKYPKQEKDQTSTYERAINARKFDILRAFLPAGAHTNLSWHTNLRQADDHLKWLRIHPDELVRKLGTKIWDALYEKYPSSFDGEPRKYSKEETATWRWMRDVSERYTFSQDYRKEVSYGEFKQVRLNILFDRLKTDVRWSTLVDMLQSRPPRTPLPPWMSEIATIRSTFPLDFGSFRDLQRHRNGVVRMPLLTTSLGFNQWYLNQLPPYLRRDAESLIKVQTARIQTLGLLGVDAVTQQYYCAMGFNVGCEVVQSLPAFIYRVELRSGVNVHPTLRKVVHDEITQFNTFFPYVKVHADWSPDMFSIARGDQTITEKTT